MARIPKEPQWKEAKMPTKKGARAATPDTRLAWPKRGPFSLKAEFEKN